jgi:hypothetical protein
MIQTKASATKEINPNIVPNFMGLDKISATNIGIKINLPLIHKGMGVVHSQQPAPGTPITSDLSVKLEYSPPNYE